MARFDSWWNSAQQPQYDAERAAVALKWPNARVLVLARGSHNLMFSEPDAVPRAIAKFRSSVRGEADRFKRP